VLVKTRAEAHRVFNLIDDWGIEKCARLTRLPFPVAGVEILRYHVPSNTGEDHVGMSPRLEIVVEFVIFQPC